MKFCEFAAQAEFGHVVVVEAQADGAVVFGLHDKVGDDLLDVLSDGFSHRASRARVELYQFCYGIVVLLFGDVQLLQDFILVFLRELVTALADDVVFGLFQGRIFLALDLQQEAFLEVSRADARRVEVLDDGKYVFRFLGRGVYPLVDGEFVDKGVDAFPQEPVVVERADKVFAQLFFFGGQGLHVKLFFQGFVERDVVRERDVFGLVVFRAVVLLQLVIGYVVFGAVIAQREVLPVIGIRLAVLVGGIVFPLVVVQAVF